ncbi:MAG: DMT family transporter [Desulfitobacterium hafniense]|nr:DMT family transporter [Desulfitobacterium hafniense]
MLRGKLDSHRIGVVEVLISTFGFSLYPIFGKYVFAGGASLSTTLTVRFIIAAVIFWLIIFSKHGFPRLNFKTWLLLWVMGGVGYSSMAGLYLSSVRYIPASLATLLLYAYPIIVTILSVATRQEEVSLQKLLGLTSSTIGLGLIIGLAFGEINLFGILLALGASVIYSVYIVLGGRVLKTTTPLISTGVISLSAAVTYSIIGSTTGFTFNISGFTWLVIIGIALFCTVLAMLTFFSGIQKIGAASASILSTMEPVMTVVIAFVLFGEQLTISQMLGGIFVILGGILSVWVPKSTTAEITFTGSEKI